MQENLIRGGTTLFLVIKVFHTSLEKQLDPRGPVISLGRYVPQLGGGGGWYSGIFIHTWTRSILGVHNFEFQYFWGFQKNKYFWGYEDFVDIFGVITILDYI